jgi:hypothetical protein
MKNITCKTEEEVKQIIAQFQHENPNLSEELILKAIASCCSKEQIVKKHETFTGCVKERITMFKLM